MYYRNAVTIGQDGTIYIGAKYALTPEGEVKWESDIGGSTSSSAIGKDGTLYAGVYITGEGYFIAVVATPPTAVGDGGIVAARPEEYALFPCYPNPFNPNTTIRYQLPEPGYVRLVISDLLGQEVRTLVDGEMEAGYWSVGWEGRAGQVSGQWDVSLSAGGGGFHRGAEDEPDPLRCLRNKGQSGGIAWMSDPAFFVDFCPAMYYFITTYFTNI